MLSKKQTLLFIIFTIATVPIGKFIWPPAHDITMPTTQQLPFFVVLALIESISLTAGIIFTTKIWGLIKKIPQTEQKRFKIMSVAIVWSLANWWAHDNLHIHNGQNIVGLLFIEYSFHVTLIAGSLVLAYHFYRLVEEKLPK